MDKKCKKCSNIKPLKSFRKRKDTKDGYGATCKNCESIVNKEYRERNSKTIKLKRDKNKDKLSIYFKDRYNNNRVKISNYHKKRYDSIKDDKLKYDKKYRLINREKICDRRKEYYKNNKESLIKKAIAYKDKRKKTDPLYKFKINVKNCIGNSIRKNGFVKNSRTHRILNCSFEEFKEYLESKFEPWMTWDNYGKYNGKEGYGWDIDHIIPSSSATSEEDILKLNRFSNLQPLCSYINRVIKRNNQYK